MANVVGMLDVKDNEKPHIIGDDQVAKFKRIYKQILYSGDTMMLTGFPGCGKTHFGMELTKALVRKFRKDGHACNGWHIQLTEESTQSSIFGDYRIAAEGEVQELVAAGLAARDGDVIFIDEVPHALPNSQTALNRALDLDAMISVADLLIEKNPYCRFILGGNGWESGVYGLKLSFASRLFGHKFDFPSAETEADIALDIAVRSFKKTMGNAHVLTHVNHGVVRYLTSVARDIRKDTELALPVSARNIAMALKALALEEYDAEAQYSEDWEFGDTGEAMRSKVAERVFFTGPEETNDLHHEMISGTMQFIAGVTPAIFIEDVEGAFMYHLHIENISPELMMTFQENIKSTIV
jgi:MoxR-like ATPase